MERHPYFDLWLHTTQEISAFLSIDVVERLTLHEWPLSCVQLLRLVDGRQLIYKSQLQATTVEPEFYAAVQRDRAVYNQLYRPWLPGASRLGILHNSVGMIFEYIDSPRLEDLQLDKGRIIEHGSRLLAGMRHFSSDLPVYTDISSTTKWSALVENTIIMLEDLIAGGQFHLTSPAVVKMVAEWARSDAVVTELQSPLVLNHSDLGGDNVFVTVGGYKIIDWQRPVRGPADLDRMTYLAAMGIDPLEYVSRGIIGLFCFLHLRWLVECKARWFPPGESYDLQVKVLADQISSL
jgi:hypothetical protein